MPILYEPVSPRGDHGIWVLTYGQPVKRPFYFDWKGKIASGETVNFNISTTCHVIISFKEHIDDVNSIMELTLDMQENNCIMLDIGQQEILNLKKDKMYHMSIVLYDSEDSIIRVLLRDLPIKVLGSGV